MKKGARCLSAILLAVVACGGRLDGASDGSAETGHSPDSPSEPDGGGDASVTSSTIENTDDAGAATLMDGATDVDVDALPSCWVPKSELPCAKADLGATPSCTASWDNTNVVCNRDPHDNIEWTCMGGHWTSAGVEWTSWTYAEECNQGLSCSLPNMPCVWPDFGLYCECRQDQNLPPFAGEYHCCHW